MMSEELGWLVFSMPVGSQVVTEAEVKIYHAKRYCLDASYLFLCLFYLRPLA